MTDLGNKVMESMFDAWCDDECKEITPDHNDYKESLTMQFRIIGRLRMYRSGSDVFLLHGRMNIYLEQIAKNAKLH